MLLVEQQDGWAARGACGCKKLSGGVLA